MFSRVIVIAILAPLMLAPGPAVRAHDVSEGRTPPSDIYGQAVGEAERAGPQERFMPYASAERRLLKAAAASAEFGRAEPTARMAIRTTRYDAEPIHRSAYGLSNATVATCTVTTRADSGSGSLRECLSQAAATGTIIFDPVVFPPAAPATITLASALPWIKTAGLTLDGSNAGIVLDGSRLAAGAGLVVSAVGNVTLRGLQVLNFPSDGIVLIKGAHDCVIGGDRGAGAGPLGQGNLVSGNGDTGVWLQDAGTTGNRIVGNYLGTDVTGTESQGNETGVVILRGASGNLVGGETLADRNLVSGNFDGVWIEGDLTSSNRVLGNLIGTDAVGSSALGNARFGVFIGFGASVNMVGGGTTGGRNLISGNGGDGVWLQDAGTTGNRIQGNFIGTDISGAKAISNMGDGVVMLSGADDNLVGGDAPGAGNLISGNSDGVWIEGDSTAGNRIQGNFIGTDVAGTRAISNTVDGVIMYLGAKNNLVGGDTPGTGNLISGNGRIGININEDCSGNRVLGNTIGTDVSGTADVGNAEVGVLIGFGASDNVMGGETAAARNLISGNGVWGVLIKDAGTTGNRVTGNIIGADASGTIAVSNAADGVFIASGAQDNVIGGAASGASNLISGNGGSGVWLQDAETMGNRVLGNLIGVDVTGLRGLSNGNDGITILSGAGGNFIGGDAPGAGNLISGNNDRGITIQGLGSDDNRVLGNIIGTDATGTRALGNAGGGIVIKAGASNNLVGGDMPGARNLISGNDDGNDATEEAGIWIEDANTAGNRVVGNYIGTDVTGAVVLSNGDTGIGLGLGAHDTIIGGETPGAANVISGNGGHGVALQGAGTNGNRITGNTIGLDATGTYSMTNGYEGVFIGFAASNNVVGGEDPGTRNLINGGVWLQNLGTTGNRVLGNYIGTDSKGTAAPGNHGHGVALIDGPSGNVVGGETSAARNVISGNAEHGVFMQGTGTTANEVVGNYIGTDVTGALSMGNGVAGISIIFGANLNLIGGNQPGTRNVISGNGQYGVQLQDSGTSGNRVRGNCIGTDVTGTAAIPNAKDGVVIANGASDNLIGGETPGERNLISGNGEIGVNLSRSEAYAGDGATANRVLGNYIGTDVTGTQAMGNGQSGVHIGFGAYDNVVGGEKPGMRNIISGNGNAGVLIKSLETTGNSVLGNYIGTDVTGTRAIPNEFRGVAIRYAANGNVVGGEAPGEGNLISGNREAGVKIQDPGTTRNRVVGNTVGADASGASPLSNLAGGVEFADGSEGNTLGPDNSIVFNDLGGVIIRGQTTLHNTITRNRIHHNGGFPIVFVDLPLPIDPPALGRYADASHTLTGLACPSCRVEVFANPDAQPAGTVYLATVTANAAGAFTLTLSSAPPLPFLHATTTDPQGTTSQFSSGLNTNRARIYLPITLR